MLGREFDLFMVVNVGIRSTEEYIICKLNLTNKEVCMSDEIVTVDRELPSGVHKLR